MCVRATSWPADTDIVLGVCGCLCCYAWFVFCFGAALSSSILCARRVWKHIESKCVCDQTSKVCGWLLGVVTWFLLQAREVPGSIPGTALQRAHVCCYAEEMCLGPTPGLTCARTYLRTLVRACSALRTA